MREDVNKKWVAIYGNAVSINENRPESYGRDITLRYKIYSPFAGDYVRLTFDNYTGLEPVYFNNVTVLLYGKIYQVTFNGGYESIWLAAGENIVSDPLRLRVSAGCTFDVSFYLGEYTSLRASVAVHGPLSAGVYAKGDATRLKHIPIDIKRRTSNVYFLSNISLYTDESNRSIVCYGDSITAQDWPDYLSFRCKENDFNHTAVIRRATSGSRILREYTCLTYESYGLMGKNRFDHEVPTDGADTIIIQQGINDIIHPVGTNINPFRPLSDLPTLEQLKEGMSWYIEKAKAMGLITYVGTLLPIKGWRTYAPFREELRREFNDWIKTQTLSDGYIDFAMAVSDINDRTAMEWKYDSGDHLHPSADGYKKMAEEVPEKLLR